MSQSGEYNEFHNMIFQQDYPVRQLVSINGDNITWDSVAFKYTSNANSSSNHTIRTGGDVDNLTFRYCHFYNGSRTIIWIMAQSSTSSDDFLMEYCNLTGTSNHPAIQIMPYTNVNGPSIKRSITANLD